MIMEIEFPRKFLTAYKTVCKPLCKKYRLPQSAVDILLFLGNNPKYKTARDIVEIRNIKANLVSVNVEKLVQEGYLERRMIAGDRRKTELICTEKAKKIIREGQKIQQDFYERLFDGMDEESKHIFRKALNTIEQNTEEILKGEYEK